MEGLDALPPDSLPAGVGIRLFGRGGGPCSGSFSAPCSPGRAHGPHDDRHCAIKWGPACRLGFMLSKERRGDDMAGWQTDTNEF